MKKTLKIFGQWIVLGLGFIFVLGISYLIIKARTTTNPTTTDDWAWMYATAGTTLTADKWNNLINRSSFRAYLNTAQSIWSTSVKINMNAEEFDTNNEFDTSNARFTPKRAGKYFLTAVCTLDSIWDTYAWRVDIYKNWSIVACGSLSANWANISNDSTVSTVVDANGSTDYFEVYCKTTKTTSNALLVASHSNYFAGFRVE